MTASAAGPVAARLAEDKAAAGKLLTAAGHVQEALAVPGLIGRYMPGWDLWEDVEKAAIRWAVLVAALEAVLKAHRNAGGRCAWCREVTGERMKWPCGEYQAIESALRDAQGGAGQ